jgi:3-phosphoshikimate 1-carboxyvinyltransferase
MSSKLVISPDHLGGTLQVVSSKSLTHRYLIAAALANGTSVINNCLDADDITATIDGLTALGAIISLPQVIGQELKVTKKVIDCNESGSTLRFLIPLAALLNEELTFVGKGRLLYRPQTVYQQLFDDHQIEFHHYLGEKITIKGRLQPGDYQVKGNLSSQFISGLLFALPILSKNSTLTITDKFESKPYVDLTVAVLKEFGIIINEINDYQYSIQGNQNYCCGQYNVEGDYSQAAFFIVAALIGNQITLTNLNPNSLQGDKTILTIIKDMGAKFEFNEKGLTVYPSKLTATMIDLAQIPDLGPILMVLATQCEGITTFINFERLVHKESDRLNVMIDELTKLGVEIVLTNDKLMIKGTNGFKFKGNRECQVHGDHRIAMALAVAATQALAPITINDYQVVAKSYPHFFKDFIKLGGKVNYES